MIVELRKISFSYNREVLLSDVSLSIQEGSFIGILGDNGSGKTTLLRIMLGLLKPNAGEALINAEKISYVSQTTSKEDLSFPADVFEVVSSGLTTGRIHFFTKSDKRRVDESIDRLGLREARKKSISELSGGQMQRVKIAKALVSEPDLVVLDEPDAGMDGLGRERLAELVETLHQEGRTIVMVSHRAEDFLNADQVYRLASSHLTLQEKDHV